MWPPGGVVLEEDSGNIDTTGRGTIMELDPEALVACAVIVIDLLPDPHTQVGRVQFKDGILIRVT